MKKEKSLTIIEEKSKMLLKKKIICNMIINVYFQGIILFFWLFYFCQNITKV
jgi:hypothetical protein